MATLLNELILLFSHVCDHLVFAYFRYRLVDRMVSQRQRPARNAKLRYTSCYFDRVGQSVSASHLAMGPLVSLLLPYDSRRFFCRDSVCLIVLERRLI